MLDHHYVADIVEKQTVYFLGSVQSVTVTPLTYYVTGAVEKESVDTGEFIPGVYRVNPYSVSEQLFRFATNLELKIEWDTGTLYHSVDFVSGALGAAVVKLVDNSLLPDFSNLAERTMLRAHSNLAKSVANLGEDLGEIAETLEMIRHPFSAIRDFLYSCNHRRLGLYHKIEHYVHSGHWLGVSKRGAAKAASDAWLEFRYGFMPLCYTIQDIMKVVDEMAEPFLSEKILSSKSTLSNEVSRESGDLTSSVGHIHYTYQQEFSTVGKVSTSIQYRLDNELSLMDKLGLTPRHLPELAWELTRLSFVVDWFVEIGPWLGTYLRFQPGVTVLGNTVGYKTEQKVVARAMSYGRLGYETPCNIYLGETLFRKYERLVNQPTPLLPQFTSLSPTRIVHVVDALALFHRGLVNALTTKRR